MRAQGITTTRVETIVAGRGGPGGTGEPLERKQP